MADANPPSPSLPSDSQPTLPRSSPSNVPPQAPDASSSLNPEMAQVSSSSSSSSSSSAAGINPSSLAEPSEVKSTSSITAIPPASTASNSSDSLSQHPSVTPSIHPEDHLPGSTVASNSPKQPSSSGSDSDSSNLAKAQSTSLDPPQNTSPKLGDQGDCSVTFLLASGHRMTLHFPPTATIDQARQALYARWPEDWEDEAPSSASLLKIIYFGRFLENSSTLAENKMEPGKPNIVHVSIKLKAPSLKDAPAKGDSTSPKCCPCSIL
ncbi:MAG: ubiquitin-related domain-containing protein [Piptocephalis tieghemiana]|nr:MAG: ubiquitin-related domain-containing protein [Piptocephalis tieghemiana]